MTKFIGSGLLKKFGKTISIDGPILVRDVGKFLKLPKELADNLIVVRKNKKLNEDEVVRNEDEIHIFFAAMGG